MKSLVRALSCAAALAAPPLLAVAADPPPDGGANDRLPAPSGPAAEPREPWGEPIPPGDGDRARPEAGAARGDQADVEAHARADTRDDRDQRGVPEGQWVFTRQYGWVWMPYSRDYAYAPAGSDEPLMYVYGPSFGWAWVGAPWLWGWGPDPYFTFGGAWWWGWHAGPRWAWGGYYGPGWWGHRGWWGGYGPRWSGTRPMWGGGRVAAPPSRAAAPPSRAPARPWGGSSRAPRR